MNVFDALFNALPRQGPGSEKDSLQALGIASLGIEKVNEILDIGCGAGAQTMVLLENSDARVSAVDISQKLLDKLEAKVEGEMKCRLHLTSNTSNTSNTSKYISQPPPAPLPRHLNTSKYI